MPKTPQGIKAVVGSVGQSGVDRREVDMAPCLKMVGCLTVAYRKRLNAASLGLEFNAIKKKNPTKSRQKQ